MDRSHEKRSAADAVHSTKPRSCQSSRDLDFTVDNHKLFAPYVCWYTLNKSHSSHSLQFYSQLCQLLLQIFRIMKRDFNQPVQRNKSIFATWPIAPWALHASWLPAGAQWLQNDKLSTIDATERLRYELCPGSCSLRLRSSTSFHCFPARASGSKAIVDWRRVPYKLYRTMLKESRKLPFSIGRYSIEQWRKRSLF